MLEDTITDGLAELGLSYGAETPRRFRQYYTLLTEANAVMNLTAIHGETETARLHFLDSLAPLLRFSLDGASLIDVGTGAGFPGVPLKLLCPSLSLTLLDAQRKRVDFLRRVCRELALPEVRCIQGRAEEPGALREQYDYATSRAVARLNVLCELCLPYVRPGGAFLALKGPAAEEELREAGRALSLLGAEAEDVMDYPVPGEALRHKLVILRKRGPTPARYPRKFALIKKSPL